MRATDRHLGVTMKKLEPILRVVSDTAAAMILGGLLAVPCVLVNEPK